VVPSPPKKQKGEQAMKKDGKTTFAKTVQRELKKCGYDSFIGGSYRFGFEKGTSDVDIFVNSGYSRCYSDLSLLEAFAESITAIAFPGISQFVTSNGRYDNCFCQYKIGNIVHINFYREKDYLRMEGDHILVEKFLNRHKLLKKMRVTATSGTIFYQHILDMAKQENFKMKGVKLSP
jgi:hypothetical protein